ncbi:MAG: RluA family pseudouridine synthase [Patescibacteria group bacterium]
MIENIFISKNETGRRIDLFLFEKYPSYSRTYFKNLIQSRSVLVNSKAVKPSYLLRQDDKLRIDLIENKGSIDLEPEDIDLNIIFENDDVIVLDKQAGLVVHPATGNFTGTLVNALIHHFPEIKTSDIEESGYSKTRPGIAHRLDKDTSGLLVVAKNQMALRSLSKQIKNRTVEKKYLALCFGWPKNKSGTVSNFIGRNPKNRKKMAILDENKGRLAVSDYKVLKYYKFNNKKFSLVEYNIKTGRTHQIRVHSKYLNIPILGDLIYGTKESVKLSKSIGVKRQLLHSYHLAFYLPGETKQSIYETKMPDDFVMISNRLTIV